MTITHYIVYPDEASAKAAMSGYLVAVSDGSMSWRRDIVDGPIPIVIGTGVFAADTETGEQVEIMTVDPNCHLNVGLPGLDQALIAISGFIGARDDDGNTIAGTPPNNPRRVFA